ncbi:hypothetical protein Tco_0563670 [Tanacetum coccineum]
MKAIHSRSCCLRGTSIPTNSLSKKVVERGNRGDTDKVQTNFQGSTATNPTSVIPHLDRTRCSRLCYKTTPIPESDIPKSLPKPNIPYHSRRDDQKSRDKASIQMVVKIFHLSRFRFDLFARMFTL